VARPRANNNKQTKSRARAPFAELGLAVEEDLYFFASGVAKAALPAVSVIERVASARRKIALGAGSALDDGIAFSLGACGAALAAALSSGVCAKLGAIETVITTADSAAITIRGFMPELLSRKCVLIFDVVPRRDMSSLCRPPPTAFARVTRLGLDRTLHQFR